jgi:translation initiation factor IF-1
LSEEEEKELSVLDAKVVAVINDRAFRAELANGHDLVAFGGRRGGAWAALRPGRRVKVRVSPFDLSRGEIVAVADEGRT